MLTIGDVAGLTGLSVKALRHYDKEGVLVPAEVDDRTGYRFYGEGQVRAAATARALRDAGVPLADVAEVVAGSGALDALHVHRQRVLDERAREDLAFTSAEQTLRALDRPVAVVEREAIEQPFVGQVIAVDLDEAESLSDEDANGVLESLFQRLQSAGVGPSGQFWTTMRSGKHGTVEVVCCWPTAVEVDAALVGGDAYAGVLAQRTELVATWSPSPGEELVDGAAHPAIVALFDAIAGRESRVRDQEVRQTVRGQREDDFVVEVSISLAERS